LRRRRRVCRSALTFASACLTATRTPRRTRGKHPVKDHEALGRLLAELGRSRIANNLNQLARAANSGSLPVTPEVEADLIEACEEVAALRGELIKALGLPAPSEPAP
jgi:hypothetical protein